MEGLVPGQPICGLGSTFGVEFLVKFLLTKSSFCPQNSSASWTKSSCRHRSQTGGARGWRRNPWSSQHFPLPSIFHKFMCPHCFFSTVRAKVAQPLALMEAALLALHSHFNFCPQIAVLNIVNLTLPWIHAREEFGSILQLIQTYCP